MHACMLVCCWGRGTVAEEDAVEGLLRIEGMAAVAAAQVCPQRHSLVLREPTDYGQRQEAVDLPLTCGACPCMSCEGSA